MTSKKKKMKPTKLDDVCKIKDLCNITWLHNCFVGQSQITLRDLCPQDKARVRQLVEDLARLGTEKVWNMLCIELNFSFTIGEIGSCSWEGEISIWGAGVCSS